jgi:S-DNA-T family DNA segregation ATPase FtsK/SpoIIIE
MRFYSNVKTKQKQKFDFRGLLLIAASFFLLYCLIIPDQTGSIGRFIARISFLLFGQGAFLYPLLVFWWGYILLKPSIQLTWRLDVVWGVLILCAFSCFLSLFGTAFYNLNYGGWLGLKLNPFFRRIFGPYFSILVTLAISVYLASRILRISLRKMIASGWVKILEDYETWQKEREEIKKATVPKIRPVSEKEAPRLEPKQEKPKIITQPELPKISVPKEVPPKIEPKKQPPAKPVKDIKTIPGQVLAPEMKPAVRLPYNLPPVDLLDMYDETVESQKDEHLHKAELLTKTLLHFNIEAQVKEIIPGPVITRYDMELAPGIKLQAVTALSENIALVMKVPSIRVAAIPEKSAVGIEVPNATSKIVGLRGIVSSPEFLKKKSLLTLALGRTTDGSAYVADLSSMPHLLIAGATGSGKSVGIHSIITSILFKARPDEVKLLLIDPKRLELPSYKGLPHLYDPCTTADHVDIITQPKEAAASLNKLVKVMESRYEKFAKESVRNIDGYNEKMEASGGQKEYFIVVVIDELADLMLISSKEVEDSIQRLAQMARAVGIHLILATQRPSVDVITGVIKANFPARIAFQTTSKVDSRVILDAIGADALTGKGDMLFIPPGESKMTRLQGGYVSAKEVEKVVNFIRAQNVPASYESLVNQAKSLGMSDAEDDKSVKDLYQALVLVRERKRVSQDLLKAHFGSSAKATNILSLLETKGFIHKPEGTNRWQIHFDKINEFLDSTPEPM